MHAPHAWSSFVLLLNRLSAFQALPAETVGAAAGVEAADAAPAAEARAAEREPRSESCFYRAHEMTKNEMREIGSDAKSVPTSHPINVNSLKSQDDSSSWKESVRKGVLRSRKKLINCSTQCHLKYAPSSTTMCRVVSSLLYYNGTPNRVPKAT